MKKTIKYLLAATLLASTGASASAQAWFTPEVEQRAEELLKHMTLREKLSYGGATRAST